MPNSSTKPHISFVIPSWSGEVGRLMRSIEQQTFREYDVEIVRGVSPAARARNVGVARTGGDIILFIDDDAYFGHERVLQTLVDLLHEDPRTGVVGTSKLAPPSASAFQRAVAAQVPRMIYPVVRETVVSNPPAGGYGFTAISTTCCAVWRSIFEEVGGFDETMTTGPEDVDFFERIHRRGYNILLAADSAVYHDPPPTLRDLLRKSFWYGVGHALLMRKSPQQGITAFRPDRLSGKLVLAAAILCFPAAFFVHLYFDPARRLVVGFRPLKTLSTYAVLSGYVYGWYRGAPTKPAATYRGARPGTHA